MYIHMVVVVVVVPTPDKKGLPSSGLLGIGSPMYPTHQVPKFCLGALP